MSSKNDRNLVWAVIGGGNGGQSAAGHLGILGFRVRIYDIVPETIQAIHDQGGINVEGAVEGFGPVEKATLDIREAIEGADIIMVIAPALYHRTIAGDLATHIRPGQKILVHPGATFGAVEFRQVFLEKEVPLEDITIAEAQSLVYACRAASPGNASIKGIKKSLAIAAIPARKTDELVQMLQEAFPQMHAARNVLETSLTNLNVVMHPAPSLLNVSIIESVHPWRYYVDGITPSIGKYVEKLDLERIRLGEAFGLELQPVLDMYKELYGVRYDTLSETVKHVDAYQEIKGQKVLATRYVLEDIPMGMVPMVSLADQIGIEVEMMKTTCSLGNFLLDRDLFSEGRTMERLGLSHMGEEKLLAYLEGN